MKIDLSGKRALVTGSSSGIGLAIARGLAGAGAEVTVNGRDPAGVDRAVARLRSDVPGARIDGIAADLGTAAGAAAVVAAFASPPDILVNNLGIFEPKAFIDIEDADWQRLFETNVMSGIRLSRAFLPAMLARDWGRIVFVSSESAIHIPAEMIHYGVTKTAQLAVARGIAETTGGTGVTVNSVLPGPTLSEGAATFFGKLAAEQGVSTETVTGRFIADNRPTSLLRRFATVDEVANMVVYVCSALSSATNGAALRVDGGVVRSVV